MLIFKSFYFIKHNINLRAFVSDEYHFKTFNYHILAN